eukprot:9000226-Alexandrium_andersonii.AAC.1
MASPSTPVAAFAPSHTPLVPAPSHPQPSPSTPVPVQPPAVDPPKSASAKSFLNDKRALVEKLDDLLEQAHGGTKKALLGVAAAESCIKELGQEHEAVIELDAVERVA